MNATRPKKIKMTDEVRRKLAGLLPMDEGADYPWTPDVYLKKIKSDTTGEPDVYDIPKELHPVFSLKQLSNEDTLEIKAMLSKEMNTKSKKIDMAKTDAKNLVYMGYLHKVLTGWKNLYGLASGELFEYDGEFDTMMKLPETIRTDLFSEAMRITGFIPQG